MPGISSCLEEVVVNALVKGLLVLDKDIIWTQQLPRRVIDMHSFLIIACGLIDTSKSVGMKVDVVGHIVTIQDSCNMLLEAVDRERQRSQ